MGRFRWLLLVVLGSAIAATGGAGVWAFWFHQPSGLPKPLTVPSGDQEIAWLHNTTDGSTWALFVIGLKRVEMPVDGVPSELTVDDTNAFPEQTTLVPEVVLTRVGYAGKCRVRWYKISGEASTSDWVQALATRDPAPLAIIGGATSDRAHELALALAKQTEWQGDHPLLLITTATIDLVITDPDDPSHFARVPDQRSLVEVYPGRSFRFCFGNAQMVRAVTEFVLQDPTLHPGPLGWLGLRAATAGAAGGWAVLPGLAELGRKPTVFPLEWQDDPYSSDLYNQFREHLYTVLGGHAGPSDAPRIVRDPAFSIPFSVGGFSRPNAGEAAAIRAILRNLPPPGERSLIVIPTVSNPIRRILLTLSERVPAAGRRLVAITGDGVSVNTFYRDAEWSWPARSIPIPIVFFAHANPFAWDTTDGPPPPPGYRLEPKNSTEDVLHATAMMRIVADAIFPPTPSGQLSRIADRADDVAVRFHARPDKFFGEHGNRHGRRGEHVVVLRPTTRYGDTAPGTPRPESMIEVFRREDVGRWVRVGLVPVLQEGE